MADERDPLSNGIYARPDADSVLTPEKWARMQHEWANLAREYRRNDVTIVVDLAHEGPMVMSRHPVDGQFIECTWREAQYIHERFPLVLRKVVSEHVAHFGVATAFNVFVSKILPMPPYDLPPQDSE